MVLKVQTILQKPEVIIKKAVAITMLQRTVKKGKQLMYRRKLSSIATARSEAQSGNKVCYSKRQQGHLDFNLPPH
eukprot:3414987-Amphidinium_carterae.2